MSRARRSLACAILALSLAPAATLAVPAAPADALSSSAVCGVAGAVSGLAGKACSLASHAGRVLKAGGDLLRGHVGSAVQDALGTGGGAAAAGAALSLAAVAVWTTHSASSALHETARMLSATTNPRVAAPWFSSVYWRVAGIGMLLTLPFLFAAAIQALLRSDLSLLLRSAFGYLPLATLGVAVAAQLTGLLLTATDALCGVVAGASGDTAGTFLAKAARAVAGVSLLGSSPFLACLVAVVTVMAAIALWTEMLLREAAVYVILALLPLAFAALVWPARRVWAVRTVELLVALILSKLAIVTVLTLGGAALLSLTATGFLSGFVLLVLAIFAPWAMVRLVPMAELAASAAGTLRGELGPAHGAAAQSLGYAAAAHDWAQSALPARPSDDAAGPPVQAQESPLPDRPDGSAGAGAVELDETVSDPRGLPSGQGPASAGAVELDETVRDPGGLPSGQGLALTGDEEPPAPASGELDGGVASPGGQAAPSPDPEPHWQADHDAWPEIALSAEDGWPPPPPPTTPSGEGGEREAADLAPPPDAIEGGLPPAPEPEDGSL